MGFPPIAGYYGVLGAGKTGLITELVYGHKRRYPYSPVVSTVPIALPGPGTFFLAANVGDYIAAGLAFSQFCWSDEARKMALNPRPRRRAGVTDEWVLDIFQRLQQNYRQTAVEIDWRDKNTIDGWLMAHNYTVLHNMLGNGALDLAEIKAKAAEYKGMDFYKMADHIDDTFRFKYRPPHMKFTLILDEVGVAASADDNNALKNSAFYPWLAQLRKFGGIIMYSGHHPTRVFKQMREVTDAFYKVFSWDFPSLRRRLYVGLGFNSEEAFDMMKGLAGFPTIRFVPYDTLSRYPTFWIVRQPEGLQEYAKQFRS